MRGGGLGASRRHPWRLIGWLLLTSLSLPTVARAVPPLSPGALSLHLGASSLHWEIVAREDLVIVALRLQPPLEGVPAEEPNLPASLRAGERLDGTLPLEPSSRTPWFEVGLLVRTRHGEQWIGAGVGAPVAAPPQPALQALSKPRRLSTAGAIRGRFVYEDRLLGERGYTGATQLLPVRHVDVDLVDAAGIVQARGRLSGSGMFQLALPRDTGGPLHLRLWTSTRDAPDFDVAVLEPDEASGSLVRHSLETPDFDAAPGGVDLGTFILRDPDGFGKAQAFHILDVALDALEMLATPDWLGQALQDSLRFLWGPQLRIRVAASQGALIQLASPAGGDTDGWSDSVILHEVGHFVAKRYGRDDSAGGPHFLGDVEQDLSLAFSEGWATAFASIVRSWRAATRHNLSGVAVDSNVSWYVDVGLPPPSGIPGGLQLAWDLETSTWLDGRPLPRDGIGSESNVAAILWDLVDTARTGDSTPDRDDDPGSLGPQRWWEVSRALRDLPRERQATLEDYWLAASAFFDPAETNLLQEVFVREGGIGFVADASEPDDEPSASRAVSLGVPASIPGGVVIDEIDVGTSPAVELTNRGDQWVSMQGWRLHARRNGASTNPGLTLRFPPGVVLAPGARLVLHRHGRLEDSTVRHLFVPFWTMPWFPETDGALILENPAGETVDFVRWSSIDAVPSQTAVPLDTRFVGTLGAPGFGKTLSRLARIDTDQASDFIASRPTLGAPNDVEVLHHTFFPVGDRDAFHFLVPKDGAYTVQTLGLRNGAEPVLELSASGRPPLHPRLQAPDGAAEVTLWLRAGEVVQGVLQHAGEHTRFGTYDLTVYAEAARTPHPPEGLQVERLRSRGAGGIALRWWNGADYDSTSLWLDGVRHAVLPGTVTQWQTPELFGRHRLKLVGYLDGVAASAPELVVEAGELPTALIQDFENALNEDWELEDPWSLGVSPGRSTQSLCIGSAGPYPANRRAVAQLLQTVEIRPGARLSFEHVCIVQPEDVAAVQVSDDAGSRWVTLGRWNLLDHRGGENDPSLWSDGQPDGEDWVHESLPLEDYAGKSLLVRFLFQSDVYGSGAGWWIDSLQLGDEAVQLRRLRFVATVPNPFNASTRLHFEVSRSGPAVLQIFDVRGRLVRLLLRQDLEAGVHDALWDGTNGEGLPMASGVYFVRLESLGEQTQSKIVLLR